MTNKEYDEEYDDEKYDGEYEDEEQYEDEHKEEAETKQTKHETDKVGNITSYQPDIVRPQRIRKKLSKFQQLTCLYVHAVYIQ